MDSRSMGLDRSLDRRGFLAGGLACLLVRRQEPPGERGVEGRTLVLVQLSGGNDGLSMLVPRGDDAYGRARSATKIGEKELLALDERRGLHPALVRLRALWDEGALALVEGVGYPHPNRSHFQSLAVWHSARNEGPAASEGWIGRLARAAFDASDGERALNRVVHVGLRPPFALHSSDHPPVAFTSAEHYRRAGPSEELSGPLAQASQDSGSALDFVRGVQRDAERSSQAVREAVLGYRARVSYPDSSFGKDLRTAAALIDADLGTRIVSLELDGFDTHADQRPQHDRLMATLDGGLGAFLADLETSEAGRGTLVAVFSEFGRRVEENGSRGTDHGCAAPMLVLGSTLEGGFYGAAPSLAELDEGDLGFTTDFRSVYATLIERCFGVSHERVLDERFPLLGFA